MPVLQVDLQCLTSKRKRTVGRFKLRPSPAQHEQLSVLQSRQSTAVTEHQSAAQSASAALEDVLSRVNQSLPVRRSDIVRCRNSLQATVHTASRVESTTEAVASHQNTMKEHVDNLRARFAREPASMVSSLSPVRFRKSRIDSTAAFFLFSRFLHSSSLYLTSHTMLDIEDRSEPLPWHREWPDILISRSYV
ncbi:hypothetical protein N7541_005307 [Penicillium brevicompactum]|uniref:Uncharacterized protein n=1 Tax=Penicillium brevicompactum TaxID=5074 RepID=A0A9W9UVI5_PENBR|nr:hypothetical protein N7541_005307 [Penicillium brevicompactum]